MSPFLVHSSVKHSINNAHEMVPAGIIDSGSEEEVSDVSGLHSTKS